MTPGRQQITVALLSLYLVENRGLRVLAAWLREHGHRVVEVYFKDWASNHLSEPTERELELLVSVLRDEDVDLVGLSIRASGYHRLAADLTRHIREATSLPVIWGGFHPTSVPEDCIDIADYVAIGEGEGPLLALADHLARGTAPRDVPGLWSREDGGVHRGPACPLEPDPDRSPLPDYRHADKRTIQDGRLTRGEPYRHTPLLQLSASEGCPYSTCSFCGNTVLRRVLAPHGGRFYRLRSPEAVVWEITTARRDLRRVRSVRFEDGVFGFDRDWVRAFAPLYGEQVGLPFSCMADPRVVDAEWLDLLRGVGLSEIYMGIQHTEHISHTLYNRRVSNEQVLRAARAVHAAGLRASYHVVLDDPVSTEADRQELFELLLALPRPYNLFLFSLTIFPNSPLADDLLHRGLITEDDIEGRASRIFDQWRVTLDHDRPPDQALWAALMVLAPRRGLPRPLLRRAARSQTLHQHPLPVVAVARAVNLAKMPALALDMLRRGEVDRRVLRRWLTRPSRWVTA